MYLVVTLIPELFEKVGETGRNNFHQVSSKFEPDCPGYDQKTKLTTKNYLNVSVRLDKALISPLQDLMTKITAKNIEKTDVY